jgi:two-component system nitrogen regulation response regulator GlnG
MSGGDDTATLDGPRRAPRPLKLVVVAGPDRGKELAVERGTYVVGKAPSCALMLSDRGVSRAHLELEVLGDGVRARDLGSKNGSFYARSRFTEVTLGVGAVVTLGESQLQICASDEAEALPPSAATRFGGLIGRSLAMRRVFTLLERVAATDTPVLIEGETGTGKEVCAEAIHRHSARAPHPFVVCDLAGVARSLIESELFGHVRGAFTGASSDRDGAFTNAHRGTLFLDEIGELEAPLQPRLLRALERREVKPVGATRPRRVDLRVVAATNRDLQEEGRAGRFRTDLYHRLAVVRVRLPPLRERKEDIPLLVEEMLGPRARDLGDDATLALLSEHDWPGNVRELRNVLERALSLSGGGPITPSLLAPEHDVARDLDSRERFNEAKERLLAQWERDFLERLLKRTGGNLSRASREGGINRAYLYTLLRKHGLGGAEP